MSKVLIIGQLYPLVDYLVRNHHDVFAIPGDNNFSDNVKCVDIREDASRDILDFVLENDIDLTIVTSKKCLNTDIVEYFQVNNKFIFAPCFESASFVLSLSEAKRLLYKFDVPTPKFAFFDKLNFALDYIENSDYPLIISNDKNDKRSCCINYKTAKLFIEDILFDNNDKVVIENFVRGHSFTLYFVTDGYLALPISVVDNFFFSENGDGGYYTYGVGCYVPDNNISEDVIRDIYKNIIVKILNFFNSKDNPYVGIIGVEAILKQNGNYVVTGFKPFFDNIEVKAILNSLDEDLYELFLSCANGSFADEYDDILINDNISVSCLVNSKSDIIDINKLDIVESDITYVNTNVNRAGKSNNFVLTSKGKTLSRAKTKLSDDIKLISFNGMKCRSDIYS